MLIWVQGWAISGNRKVTQVDHFPCLASPPPPHRQVTARLHARHAVYTCRLHAYIHCAVCMHPFKNDVWCNQLDPKDSWIYFVKATKSLVREEDFFLPFSVQGLQKTASIAVVLEPKRHSMPLLPPLYLPPPRGTLPTPLSLSLSLSLSLQQMPLRIEPRFSCLVSAKTPEAGS